jgi:hypothetical protein
MEDGSMKRLIPTLLLLELSTGCATPIQMSLDAEVDRLCAIDGGIKVYQTVDLPAEKFDKYGLFRIPGKAYMKPGDLYYFEITTTYIKGGNRESGAAQMWRSDFKVYRASDGKVLGESVYYTRRGGEEPGPRHPSSYSCPDLNRGESIEKLIFLRGSTK